MSMALHNLNLKSVDGKQGKLYPNSKINRLMLIFTVDISNIM